MKHTFRDSTITRINPAIYTWKDREFDIREVRKFLKKAPDRKDDNNKGVKAFRRIVQHLDTVVGDQSFDAILDRIDNIMKKRNRRAPALNHHGKGTDFWGVFSPQLNPGDPALHVVDGHGPAIMRCTQVDKEMNTDDHFLRKVNSEGFAI